jgi:hypothetical protein
MKTDTDILHNISVDFIYLLLDYVAHLEKNKGRFIGSLAVCLYIPLNSLE